MNIAQKFEDISHFFLLLEKRGRIVAAFFAGVLAILGQAPFHAYPVFVVSCVVLFWLIDGLYAQRSTIKRPAAFTTGWAFGFGYSLSGFYWIIFPFFIDYGGWGWLGIPAWIVLSAGLGIFTGIAAKIALVFWSPALMRIFPFIMAFTLADVAKGTLFTGLPWNAYGYTLAFDESAMQMFSIFGLWGASALALLLPAAIAVLPDPKSLVRKIAVLISTGCILISVYGYGLWRLDTAPELSFHDYRIGLVQTHIPQQEKWQKELRAGHFETMMRLSVPDHKTLEALMQSRDQRTKVPQYNALGLSVSDSETIQSPQHSTPQSRVISNATPMPDLLIWPETALPFLISEDPEKLTEIALLLNNQSRLITGAVRVEEERDDLTAYNALYLLGPNAEVEATYDKIHLVPFGEYMPFSVLLSKLGLRVINQIKHGFEKGSERKLLDVGQGLKVLPLICYEAIFPISFDKTGRPDFIVNISNDAWFGQTSGPEQHAHQVRMRSVETGIPLIRVTNFGVTYAVDSYGRILTKNDQGSKSQTMVQLPKTQKKTIYQNKGKLIFILGIVIFGILSTFNRIFFRE